MTWKLPGWNKGISVGKRKPFSEREVTIIKEILINVKNFRDLALFCVGIDTMLRGGDLLQLRVSDVMYYDGTIMEEFNITQKKTKKGNTVNISEFSRKTLLSWINESGKLHHDFIFTGIKKNRYNPITTDYYGSLIKKWAQYARLDPRHYGGHSIRRTKASIVFGKTNNPEIVRELLGHSSLMATSSYLDVGKQKALAVAKSIDLFK